jgi:hypothetical protein
MFTMRSQDLQLMADMISESCDLIVNMCSGPLMTSLPLHKSTMRSQDSLMMSLEDHYTCLL